MQLMTAVLEQVKASVELFTAGQPSRLNYMTIYNPTAIVESSTTVVTTRLHSNACKEDHLAGIKSYREGLWIQFRKKGENWNDFLKRIQTLPDEVVKRNILMDENDPQLAFPAFELVGC